MGYKQTASNIGRLFELLHMVSPEFSKVVASSYPSDKETWAIERLRVAYEKWAILIFTTQIKIVL